MQENQTGIAIESERIFFWNAKQSTVVSEVGIGHRMLQAKAYETFSCRIGRNTRDYRIIECNLNLHQFCSHWLLLFKYRTLG